MYIPKQFQNNDEQAIEKFIHNNGFGILINQVDGKLLATHTPLMLNAEGTKLVGHISRANKQSKNFSEGGEVMVIFNGPHTYISSSWYDHENVPTWNYIAVHVYGKIKIVEGDQLYNDLKKLVNKYEQHSEKPVSVDTMSPDYVEKEMRGVVGFEISVTSIEASYKLSQNRDEKNFQAIINQLEKRSDGDSKAIASAMKEVDRANN